MYLTKNQHGVYYYRRPIVAEDQQFWRGPNGNPKKEWIRSLRTKDRRTAIERMTDAADLYEAERAAQFERFASQNAAGAPERSQREQEEQEALTALETARQARYEARKELRTLHRQRLHLSTAELTPEEAAWRDLLREREQDLEQLQRAVEGQQATNAALAEQTGRGAAAKPSGRTIETLIEAYEADKSPGWSGSSKKAIAPVFRLLRDLFPDRQIDSITREDARELVKLLQELPTQIGKRKELRGLTIRQAIAKGRELELPTIQPKTINDGYLLHIASMFNWAIKEQWLPSSPFSGLAVHDPVSDTERRDPFTPEQLQQLFSSAPWNTPWEPGREKCGATITVRRRDNQDENPGWGARCRA